MVLAWSVCAAAIVIAAVFIILYIRQRKEMNTLLYSLRCMCENPADESEQSSLRTDKNPDTKEVLKLVDARMSQTSTAEALKTQAELHALQNQINPHFLYNTLEIIRSRALIQGNKDVAKMTEALALQFRYCINRSTDMASLERELENVHNYLLIQGYRYGDRFKYNEIISDEARNAFGALMPIMTLQPLIENALTHGINPKIGGGSITMRINVFAGRLYIDVEDDGVGIEDIKLRQMRSMLHSPTPPKPKDIESSHSTGIALDNVNRRIQQYFGKRYGLDISSTFGVGTTMRLTLPIVTEEESKV